MATRKKRPAPVVKPAELDPVMKKLKAELDIEEEFSEYTYGNPPRRGS